MSILGTDFARAVWLLKRYRKEINELDLSDLSKEYLASTLDNTITELTKLQNKFRYKRIRKTNE